ncbi:hypothetical protein HD597_009478 [Nonomuraea thailandensis]|uniref:Alpha/beta hydrolase n=1 Tax=Nonomuraea thailandensis TaxID=1188745 RepID=A0A9X2GY35_9ACTN|nr:hypothetical protein [Nonomuraea thailandensis]MCP2362458.1 hypothetical protein [Nonomuraea thailandensis]
MTSVVSGGVPIVAQDHGGSGQDVLLLHGGRRLPGDDRVPGGAGLEAYCSWTRRQLDAATRECPLIREVSLPTGHDPHVEAPGTLLRLLVEHLDR